VYRNVSTNGRIYGACRMRMRIEKRHACRSEGVVRVVDADTIVNGVSMPVRSTAPLAAYRRRTTPRSRWPVGAQRGSRYSVSVLGKLVLYNCDDLAVAGIARPGAQTSRLSLVLSSSGGFFAHDPCGKKRTRNARFHRHGQFFLRCFCPP